MSLSPLPSIFRALRNYGNKHHRIRRRFSARPLYFCIVEQPHISSWKLLHRLRSSLALYLRALAWLSPALQKAALVGSLYMCLGISPIQNSWTPSLYLSLTAFHNYKLLLRRCPSKDNFCMMTQDVIQLLTSHVLQIWAMNNTSFGIPAIKRQ